MRVVESLAPVIVSCGLVAAQQPPRGPINVLFIMSDQHNAHALGCYGNGFGGVGPSITPNLDHLATEGVRFTNAFCSSPQCVPSRLSVLTGRWPHNHGARWNGIWAPLTGPRAFPTLAREAGYATGSFGKHHMAWLEQSPPPLGDLGFDKILDMDDYREFCLGHAQSIWSAPNNIWTMARHMPEGMALTGYTFNSNEFHPAGYVTDRVLEFLEERAGDGGDGLPFVCWYQTEGPHPPLLPSGPADPHDWAHLYHPFDGLSLPPNIDKQATTLRLADLQADFAHLTDAEWQEVQSYYYGLITQIDWNIGRVLQRLDELELSRSTLVIYTADHGEMGSEMRCWTKGAGSYDATGRIPLIARLPGVLRAGATVDALVSNVDFFPTLVELTGVPITDERRAQVDGESLVDLMIDGSVPGGWRQEVFSELGAMPPQRHRMVRTLSSKYSYDEKNGGEEEFYDLTVDPWEIDDRIDDQDELVQLEIDDLRGRLAAWWNDEVGHAPRYTVSGEAWARPAPAALPQPMDGTIDVARDVNPSWLPSTAAATQEVHFGHNPLALPILAELAPMEDTFNPGTLQQGTTYYWRVDGVNENGRRIGPVWSFRTESGGVGGPGLATTPSPAQRAEDVELLPRLAWTPPSDRTGLSLVDSQTLYFGTAGAMEEVGVLAGTVTTFAPPQLYAGTTYHWRVDGTDAAGTTEGDVWIFTTSSAGLPERAEIIAPAHLAPVVPPGHGELSWKAGAGTLVHAVYFGTETPLPLVGQQPGESFDPGPLQPDTVYYWRVDEVNDFGARLSGTWRFKTARADACKLGAFSCSGVGCPCGNDDAGAGCANSSGSGALLVACGSASVAADDLRLIVSGLPPQQFGAVFMGGGSTQLPYGDGIRCVAAGAAAICRFGVHFGGEAGVIVEGPGLIALTQSLEDSCRIDPGETWNFQAWYRDGGGPCGSLFNLSNAVSVTFTP